MKIDLDLGNVMENLKIATIDTAGVLLLFILKINQNTAIHVRIHVHSDIVPLLQ